MLRLSPPGVSEASGSLVNSGASQLHTPDFALVIAVENIVNHNISVGDAHSI